MTKKILAGFVAAAALSLSAGAAEFDLKENMHKLNAHMATMQAAFITGDKAEAIKAAKALKAESDKLLGDEAIMKKMLPKDQQHKTRIAKTSAVMISDYVDMMVESTSNDGAQSAYFGVERACFRCHNLVRDW
jgi:DNA invertase Pin-like site-specific DNA recombinase